ncbi:MAG TPA: tRNA (guanosine(46)-N7)-methyltransferase TrmB [Thermoanaerobaculales bacterium]|nr:tRNA (guanosine(46)-N7)-methyltransferase TrmB [Thermoanaerobaculales bacterium]HPA80160.1 tRNA (guanosine(46)-N7)-methyltransferase TrmB [Thermoanaerobaculales bacterium]HQL31316.1 tRNA (guanosine(46)-N7)-methyltransferase TrmB [Thermoanaerobaculales bacterium]HQN94761.1 tRNA (guanosine(46)-N7)-methyltransferase TrmB [Thermoanaerobaculales bacterium]HQP42563.1 tRNA (guanosine(46)-N7)-methyltransferase TrmB [Thermoanaerobaculales bacterium]
MTDVDLDAVAVPLDWRELFGRDAPTDVEIGSGKGRFLLALAASRPERNLLAVERAGAYHKMCCERAAKHGLGNIRLLRTTAEDLLFRLLRPSSVDTLFVLFPDPWPKKRHHKRRLITLDSVAAMAGALRPGGRLLVKTDHAGYAAVIGEALAGERALRAIDAAPAFAELPVSGFEHKYLDQGRDIFAFACERV